MSMLSWYIGFFGSLLVSAGFFFQSFGLISAERQPLFLLANLLGAVCLSFPAIETGTVVALLLNGFWASASVAGLAEHWLAMSGKLVPKLSRLAAPAVLVLVAVNCYLAGFALLECLASVAVAFFIAGFFSIISDAQSVRNRATYYVTALVGNALYVPLLYANANTPNLALQLVCTVIALVAILRLLAQVRAIPAPMESPAR